MRLPRLDDDIELIIIGFMFLLFVTWAVARFL
jgi:hypothetical protein